MTGAIRLVADLELSRRDVTNVRGTTCLDLEAGLLGHHFLENESERGIVIVAIAVVDRRRHQLTILVEPQPEAIVSARFIGGDVDVQVEHLAVGHGERVQKFHSVGGDFDIITVHVEVVIRDLLALEDVLGGFEGSDLQVHFVVRCLERFNIQNHLVEELDEVQEGQFRISCGLELTAEGQRGEHTDFHYH